MSSRGAQGTDSEQELLPTRTAALPAFRVSTRHRRASAWGRSMSAHLRTKLRAASALDFGPALRDPLVDLPCASLLNQRSKVIIAPPPQVAPKVGRTRAKFGPTAGAAWPSWNDFGRACPQVGQFCPESTEIADLDMDRLRPNCGSIRPGFDEFGMLIGLGSAVSIGLGLIWAHTGSTSDHLRGHRSGTLLEQQSGVNVRNRREWVLPASDADPVWPSSTRSTTPGPPGPRCNARKIYGNPASQKASDGSDTSCERGASRSSRGQHIPHPL